MRSSNFYELFWLTFSIYLWIAKSKRRLARSFHWYGYSRVSVIRLSVVSPTRLYVQSSRYSLSRTPVYCTWRYTEGYFHLYRYGTSLSVLRPNFWVPTGTYNRDPTVLIGLSWKLAKTISFVVHFLNSFRRTGMLETLSRWSNECSCCRIENLQMSNCRYDCLKCRLFLKVFIVFFISRVSTIRGTDPLRQDTILFTSSASLEHTFHTVPYSGVNLSISFFQLRKDNVPIVLSVPILFQ